MIGAPCDLPDSYGSNNGFDGYYPYFLYDNLNLNTTASFGFGSVITASGNFYGGDLLLTGHPDTAATNYQWYYEGVALLGQNDSILDISANGLDTGCYQFYSMVDAACSIAELCVRPICVPPVIDNTLISGCVPVNAVFQNGTDTSQVMALPYQMILTLRIYTPNQGPTR
jgi:hypothetical protein